MQNSEFWTRITILYGSQTSPFILYMQKQRDFHQNDKCIWVPALICGFSMQNSDFWTRIANLYGSQISPAVLGLQCSVSSIRNTSLHGSQPSCVVFGCNRATFGQEKQVSMSPRHNLSLCACKIAWLAPELLLSMCPNPHLWLLHAKQRILDQNFKSLWVPDLICGFEHT